MPPTQSVVANLLHCLTRLTGAVNMAIENEDDVNVLRTLMALAERIDSDVAVTRGVLLHLKDLDKPFPRLMYMQGDEDTLPRGQWPTAAAEWSSLCERLHGYDETLALFSSSSACRLEQSILQSWGFSTYADMLEATPAYA